VYVSFTGDAVTSIMTSVTAFPLCTYKYVYKYISVYACMNVGLGVYLYYVFMYVRERRITFSADC